jgi:alpha-L-rhamnosidase
MKAKNTRFIGSQILLAMAALSLAVRPCAAAVAVNDLRCEYFTNPLGIDTAAPRLSWQLQSGERGQKQTAYRVLVASSAESLTNGVGDLWDSGRVASEQSSQVRYAGKPLATRQTVFWKVQAWDKDGQAGAWSPVARWELGLPEANDWSDAKWIRLAKDNRTSPLRLRKHEREKGSGGPKDVTSFPSPLLRREFEVKANVLRARAYVSGLGYNVVYVNGERCGDAVLDPGQTGYDVYANYVTHDITKLLRSGRNAIGVMLGNGFYGQNLALGGSSLNYGAPGMIAKFVIDYADGTQQVIVTDGKWRATTGPVIFDNVYAGESYDARLEQKNWNVPGFDDSQWPPVTVETEPLAPKLQAQMIPPIREVETLKPIAFWPDTQGRTVYDLGTNIAGWARLTVNEPKGKVIKLRFAEVLMPNQKDIDTASTGGFATGFDQIDEYVCSGAGPEVWQPRFTYHGGRYVEVEGLRQPKSDNLLGVVVRTDLPRAGSFVCSDEFLNRVYQTSIRTIEGNIHSIPEDCPHREKCAWLGDAHAMGETTIFNFDAAQFFTKFMNDVETTCGPARGTYQGKKGRPNMPSNVAVGKRLPQEVRPDWGAALVLVPWYLYVYCGDTQVMAEHYPLMKRFLGYVNDMATNHIVYQGYGDWCPPGTRDDPISNPIEITSTALHYGSLRRAAEIARVLGKADDAKSFDAEADLFRAAFNQKFLNRQTMLYGSQTATAVALRFGLPETADAPKVAAALAKRIQTTDKGHPTTGIHGARPIYTMLDDYGQSDVAMDMMTVNGYPGFSYILDYGFTTWPERYVNFKPGERFPDRSYNHPMQSGFAAWFHESVAGIRPDPAAPGFRHIEMKPQQFRRIEWVKATHEAPTGLIRSEWNSKDGNFRWQITVPPGSTAMVYVPAASAESVKESGHAAASAPGVKFIRHADGRAIYDLESGNYQFESRL